MVGNVWEWVNSWYDKKEKERVLRGGSWLNAQDIVRASHRYCGEPTEGVNGIGFRVALSAQ